MPDLPSPRTEQIRLCDLIVSGEVMPRDDIDWDTVEEYREARLAGAVLPPIVVFEGTTESGKYWLADGWHRLAAQGAFVEHPAGYEFPPDKLAEYEVAADNTAEVTAEIHSGGKVAAMRFAASANVTHGRRRTREDAVAAAVVAIRAFVLQNPNRQPTVRAVKEAAHVGTDVAQQAFSEWQAKRAREQDAKPVPPKDRRGGRREPSFVPPGTNSDDHADDEANDAHPELDDNGMLPLEELGDDEPLNLGGGDPPSGKKPPRQRTVIEKGNDRLKGLLRAAAAVLDMSPDWAAVSWRLGDGPPDLPETLEALTADLATFAEAVRVAQAPVGEAGDAEA